MMPGNKDVKRILHVLFAFLVPLLIFSACMDDDFEGDLMDVCPEIDSHSPDPEDPADLVLINSIITASFNKEMKRESINDQTFMVSYANGRIDGNISYSERMVTFTPIGYLPELAEVTVEITTEVYDFYDFTISEPYKWSFNTGKLEDITSPYVISTVPDNNAVDVSLTTEISATFNEPLDPASITQQSLSLHNKDNNQQVDGIVTYANNTIFFSPDAALAYDTRYEAVLAAGIADMMGNLLENDYIWTFSTEEEEDDDDEIIPVPINISQIEDYAIFAGTYIWNDEDIGNSHITGDIGIFPGVRADIDGIDEDDVDGIIWATGSVPVPGLPQKLIRDKLIMTKAYNDALDADEPEPQFLSGDLGGITLAPGIYDANILRVFNGDLVLDAGGNPDAFWVIRVNSLLQTGGPGGNIILAGDANPENVFWQVGVREVLGPNVLIGANTEFVGNILSKQGISVADGGSVTGRLFVKDGGVRLQNATIVRP